MAKHPPSLISPNLLQDSEISTDAQLYQVSIWKMTEVVEHLDLTLKERSSYTKLCAPVVSIVEEFLSSLLLSWKVLDGTFLTMIMLSLTISEEDKDAVS